MDSTENKDNSKTKDYNYKTKDFWYDLPEELIAQTPLEKRDSSRLLVLDRDTGEIQHKHFYDIIDYLNPGETEWFCRGGFVFADCRRKTVENKGKQKNNPRDDMSLDQAILKLQKLNTSW